MIGKLPFWATRTGRWHNIIFFCFPTRKDDSFCFSIPYLMDVIPEFNKRFQEWFFNFHDKDLYDDLSNKPFHFHMVIHTFKTCSLNTALNDFCEAIGFKDLYCWNEEKKDFDRSMINPRISASVVSNPVGCVRYNWHLDNPDKYQYPKEDMITNSRNYADFCYSANESELSMTADNLFNICRDSGFNKALIILKIGLENYRLNQSAINVFCNISE